MSRCDVCGNNYEQAFLVTTADGQEFVFDSIECAAHKIAPSCAHCQCRVLGHGVQAGPRIYCCASCARHAGFEEAVDNTATASSK
jgi:hypothetical protein